LKTKNIFELDPERLATTDEHGNRVYLYPEDVKGVWKNRRTVFYWALIIFYLVLPWFYINGKPVLMVNIFKREFTVLGSTLHGVEPILFFLIVASGLFFIAFVTSLLGRVWCGWACPQTVFIQTIFMGVETFIEGKARKRRERDQAPWSFNKLFRKCLKWLVFIAMSLHIAHTFVGYFVGPRELFAITMNGPSENLGLFFATMIATTVILLDFGWFREQFCIIACPYGRMQSVVMDDNSLVVSYDVKRGEPRRGTDTIARANEGDCINCYACVKVCPTGIDIRRGTQLECIACTQCIDACDDIMTKVNKPKGLIRYSSENEINGKKRKLITPRSIVYIVISTLFVSAFIYFLNASTNLQLVFLRAKTPFQVIESGELIVNHFTLKLSHQGQREFKVNFSVRDQELTNKINVVTPVHPTLIDTPEKKIVIFFKFNPSILEAGTKKVTVNVFDEISQTIVATEEVVLVGPTH
jgi:cytochrome c oxidase accessory protein FixG